MGSLGFDSDGDTGVVEGDDSVFEGEEGTGFEEEGETVLFTEWQISSKLPFEIFQKESQPRPHNFVEGHMLECIDPENQNLICVVSVKKVQGSRLLLHVDGYGEEHDFWENAASPNLFKTGWCEENNFNDFTPPPGYSSTTFSWTDYLKSKGSSAAPKSNFIEQHKVETYQNWTIGMKLEADDKYREYIAVATVTNIIVVCYISIISWEKAPVL